VTNDKGLRKAALAAGTETWSPSRFIEYLLEP